MKFPTHRERFNSEDNNEEKLRSSMDDLDELKDDAHLCTTAYQQCVARYYNQRVKERPLKVGDLLLRRLEAIKK